MFETPVLARGSQRTIIAAKDGDVFPLLEEIKQFTSEKRVPMEQLLKYAVEAWPITNEQRYRHLEGKIYEFKGGMLRLFCFERPPRLVVITHCDKKQRQKADRKNIKRAQQIMERFEARWLSIKSEYGLGL